MTEQNGMSPADMAAVMRPNNGGLGDGFGYGGMGMFWIVILFLFAMNGGGWGNSGLNGAGGLQASMQRGFDQQATTNAINGLTAQVGNGFADAALARCSGDAAITAAITNSQYTTAQAITGAKDTIANGMNTLAMSLQQCCCDNRAGLADLKYTVATENCADRQAISDGLRDLMAQNTANTNAIIQSQTTGTQAIIDKLCQLELDSYKQKVSDQAAEIASLKNAASQVAQTAALIQDNNAQTAALIQRIAPAPIPAYQVANPNCCGTNYACGVNI